MSYLTHIEHVGSGARLPPTTREFPDTGLLFARYDLAKIRAAFDRDTLRDRPSSIWCYAALLPVDDPDNAVSLSEGWTPVVNTRRLGLHDLWIKDEGRNPSGTFKDRGASVALSRYRELGVRNVALSSTGNAGAGTVTS